jgi:hypothetical protein
MFTNKGGQLGLTERAYISLAKFSNAAEQAGIKSTAITKSPGGCRLRLTGAHGDDYELVAGSDSVTLGQIDRDGKRTRLAEASSNTEAGWSQLLAALKAHEGSSHEVPAENQRHHWRTVRRARLDRR